MAAGGKGQVVLVIRAVDIELEGTVHEVGVGVGRRQGHLDAVTLLDLRTTDLDVHIGQTRGESRGVAAADGLLEHPWPQLGLHDRLLLGLRILLEEEDGIRHGLGGGIRAGRGELGEVDGDLIGAEDVLPLGILLGGHDRDQVTGL